MAHYSEIAEFYKNKSVFITGATGLIGKGIVEKLLRSCTGIHQVFVLIRPKAGLHVQSRLQAMLETPLFDTLRSSNPESLSKVIPILGDCTRADLGMSEEDRDVLRKNVSVIIHSAANIKLNTTIRDALQNIVHPSLRVLALARTMERLEAVVHVSTAYSHAYCGRDDEIVHEKFYPMATDPKELIQNLERMEDDQLKAISPMLIQDSMNAYTFSKAIVEATLEKETLPVCIVRPSTVGATLHDPFPGWVDSMAAVAGVIANVGRGVFRVQFGHPEKHYDLVPLDLVCNTIIAAAWHRATKGIAETGTLTIRERGNKIYNACAGPENLFTISELSRLILKYQRKYPPSSAWWYPSATISGSRWRCELLNFFVQYLPAACADAVRRLGGRKPEHLKLYERVRKSQEVLEPVFVNGWNFSRSNLSQLHGSMNQKDKKLFLCYNNNINWENYMEDFSLGARQYILKDHPSTIPAARLRLRRLHTIHRGVQAFIILMAAGTAATALTVLRKAPELKTSVVDHCEE